MSQITIVPDDKLVIIDREPALNVDMASMDSSIHAIQFNSDKGEGTVEYRGPRPRLEKIESIAEWDHIVEEAEEIINCRKNPKVFYRTEKPIGSKVLVTEKGWPQPENTTVDAPPPQPTSNTSLYWSGTEFVWSVFPVSLALSDAKQYVVNLLDKQTYNLLQPSDWYVVRQGETGKPIPAEWETWRAAVRDSYKAKKLSVESKGSLPDLDLYCKSEDFSNWPNQP